MVHWTVGYHALSPFQSVSNDSIVGVSLFPSSHKKNFPYGSGMRPMCAKEQLSKAALHAPTKANKMAPSFNSGQLPNISALALARNIVKRDIWCELWDHVHYRVFNKKWWVPSHMKIVKCRTGHYPIEGMPHMGSITMESMKTSSTVTLFLGFVQN